MVWGDVLRDDLGKPPSWFEGMRAMGQPLGISFDFEGDVGNSLDSLRLLLWADTKGKQEQLAERLAEGHFEKRRSVADHGVLLSACEEIGLSAADATEVLEGDAYAEEVWAEYSQIQRQGVHSIPVFVFDDKWTMSGSHPVEDYVNLIRKLEAQL
eukprot:TRINITY_DN18049_c0_g1_i1.p1 TRINITY_DN18049_c0_g1~~TRINITY_DN18049_c0_g1_i1.p1  ORF type:complete len:155 (+),score=44.43 TRINITY_DN18049_c0_g1_i1:205-669(+)